MLGLYRLILAALVALSHAGVGILGLNPGVMAVAGFYLASGYVMTGLLRMHFPGSAAVWAFYADRALRLGPHYLAVAGLTLLWYWAAPPIGSEYLSAPPTLGRMLENLLIVPLNFFMFNGANHFTLIPPAWSLGAEIQFYLIIPFLLLWRLRLPALVLSLCVFATAANGWIPSDWFGYRLLPGILFVFLLGSYLFDIDRVNDSGHRRRLVVAVLAAAGVTGVALRFHGTLELPVNREILLGLAIGVLVLASLGHRKRTPLDSWLGNLSYGVFLNHFLIMWSVFGGRVDGPLQLVAFVATSIAFAALTYYAIERPLLSYRHRLRSERKVGQGATVAY